MTNTKLAALAFVVVAVVAIFLFWLIRVPQPPDCSFSGWKRTVGVELDAQVRDLDAIKGKIGITDSQVRDYDTSMKNYALKYDAACQDVRAQRMTQGEYTCLRRNMDVDPKKISFTGNIPERSVQITNAGNSDVTYSITGLPEAFDPKPITGSVAKGTSVSVSILRTILPAPTPPIKFRVHTNLEDDSEVEISMDAQNAVLWQTLGEQARQLAEKKGVAVSIEDAVEVVNHAIGKQSPDAHAPNRFLLASNVLLQIHADSQAQSALDMAISRDPQLAHQPATLILGGLIANRQHQSDQALKLFAQAVNTASPSAPGAKGVSDLFPGSIMISKGNADQAAAVFMKPEIQKTIGINPSMEAFSVREFCALPRTCAEKLSTGLHAAGRIE